MHRSSHPGREGANRWTPGGDTDAPADRLTERLPAVPLAVHCLYGLGHQTYNTRVRWHSLPGCFFFGAFSAKMLLLRAERLPGWLPPVVGGVAFTALTVSRLT